MLRPGSGSGRALARLATLSATALAASSHLRQI